MTLKQRGRYFELPILGMAIKEITYDGMLKLVFDDPEASFLQLHSNFKVIQHNQTKDINPSSLEGLTLFYEHFGMIITTAKADSQGNLLIIFSNETEIIVEDGPLENWHYTKSSLTNPKDHLYVHGGVGRTVF